jgi:predicted HNH restriction endonuclease
VALCSSCHLAYHRRSRGNISPGQLFLDLKL